MLFTDDGAVLYDSHVICEYLDSLAPSPVLFPPAGAERWRALTLAALADGMLEAALLLVYEGRHRPEEMRVHSWVDMQQGKIDTALDVLAPADRILRLDVRRARTLLPDLIEHATQREFVYSHRWQVGDIVIWDNHRVMHRGRPFPVEERRDMRRTTLAGDGPTVAQVA